MEPVLCHTSSLEYWRSVRFGSRSFRAVQDARPLLVAPPLKGTLAQPGCWWLKRPLHVLVAESHKRRTSKEVISHIEGNELPSGSILDTCNGFSICSPELCFVQMATMLDLPHLIELGFEWCGTYDTSTDHLRECAPLTSAEKLRTYVESLGPVHGRKKALRALRYVLNGSASPRETALAMILHLPYAMGGYGIEAPLLNERVDLSERARRIAGRRYVVCDLLWPRAMLDVEYDGKEHAEETRIAKDAMRRNALTSMGFTVITVTKWQIGDGGALNAIARTIAGRLGKQLRYRDPQFTRANLALHQTLLKGK